MRVLVLIATLVSFPAVALAQQEVTIRIGFVEQGPAAQNAPLITQTPVPVDTTEPAPAAPTPTPWEAAPTPYAESAPAMVVPMPVYYLPPVINVLMVMYDVYGRAYWYPMTLVLSTTPPRGRSWSPPGYAPVVAYR